MHTHTTQAQQNSQTSGAVHSLLRELIDYAGLFPPASLSMTQSVQNYRDYSQSEQNWILGRFILPVARLGEFEEALATLTGRPADGTRRVRLSALPGDDVMADIGRVIEFNEFNEFNEFDEFDEFDDAKSDKREARGLVESVEIKVRGAEDIERLAKSIPSSITAYFEVPLADGERCIAAVADCGRRAKIRTGGETADKFPSSESVIGFIRQCFAANVAFKATAGLHHPLRSAHRLTYEPESASGMMHGFLNVFLAAAFIRAGLSDKLATELLEEQSPQNFHFGPDAIRWREHTVTEREVAMSRQQFAVSFGSCSFTEPINDLEALQVL
jgi:hypothetical protein